MVVLTWDEWVGDRDLGDSISGVDWLAIESALDRLDGRRWTQLAIESSQVEPRTLLIGGGAGDYVVSYISDDENYTLANMCTVLGELRLVTGGQAGIFPRSIVVDRDAAARAARHFFQLESMDSSLNWVPE